MSRVVLAPKRVGETVSLQVDFMPNLPSGITVSSCVVTASVYSGTDASPSAIISGTATITAGRFANQKITAGVAGVIYVLTWTATLSDSEIVIVSGYLAVLPNTP